MDDRMAWIITEKNGRQNGRMLLSKFYKFMVNKVTFLGFREAISPIAPLDPLLFWTAS